MASIKAEWGGGAASRLVINTRAPLNQSNSQIYQRGGCMRAGEVGGVLGSLRKAPWRDVNNLPRDSRRAVKKMLAGRRWDANEYNSKCIQKTEGEAHPLYSN